MKKLFAMVLVLTFLFAQGKAFACGIHGASADKGGAESEEDHLEDQDYPEDVES